jgi:hypothetical protein
VERTPREDAVYSWSVEPAYESGVDIEPHPRVLQPGSGERAKQNGTARDVLLGEEQRGDETWR